jgi:uncharacterized protein (DUF983 family)
MNSHAIATNLRRHSTNGVVRRASDVEASPQSASGRQVIQYFWRALRLRCPVCGGGGLLRSWFKIKPQCPSCGFALQREEGYFTGAMAMNLMASEFIVTAVLVVLMITTWPLALSWPSPELQTAWIVSIVAAGLLPLITFPFSRTLWVAFDVIFRPPTSADFQETIPTVR